MGADRVQTPSVPVAAPTVGRPLARQARADKVPMGATGEADLVLAPLGLHRFPGAGRGLAERRRPVAGETWTPGRITTGLPGAAAVALLPLP